MNNTENAIEFKMLKSVLAIGAQYEPDNYTAYINDLLKTNEPLLLKIGFESLKTNINEVEPQIAGKLLGTIREYAFEGNEEFADGLTFEVCEDYANGQEVIPIEASEDFIGLLSYLLFRYEEYRENLKRILTDKKKFEGSSRDLISGLVEDFFHESKGSLIRFTLLDIMDAWGAEIKKHPDLQPPLKEWFFEAISIIPKDPEAQKATPENYNIKHANRILPFLDKSLIKEEETKNALNSVLEALNTDSPLSLKNFASRLFELLKPALVSFDKDLSNKTFAYANVLNVNEETEYKCLARFLRVFGSKLFHLGNSETVTIVFSFYPEEGAPPFENVINLSNAALKEMFSEMPLKEVAIFIKLTIESRIAAKKGWPKASLIIANAKNFVNNISFEKELRTLYKYYQGNEHFPFIEAVLRIVSIIKGPVPERSKITFEFFEDLFAVKGYKEKPAELALRFYPDVYGREYPIGKKIALRDYLIKLIGKHRGKLNSKIKTLFKNIPDLTKTKNDKKQLKKRIKPRGLINAFSMAKRKTYEEFKEFL